MRRSRICSSCARASVRWGSGTCASRGAAMRSRPRSRSTTARWRQSSPASSSSSPAAGTSPPRGGSRSAPRAWQPAAPRVSSCSNGVWRCCRLRRRDSTTSGRSWISARRCGAPAAAPTPASRSRRPSRQPRRAAQTRSPPARTSSCWPTGARPRRPQFTGAEALTASERRVATLGAQAPVQPPDRRRALHHRAHRREPSRQLLPQARHQLAPRPPRRASGGPAPGAGSAGSSASSNARASPSQPTNCCPGAPPSLRRPAIGSLSASISQRQHSRAGATGGALIIHRPSIQRRRRPVMSSHHSSSRPPKDE